MVGPFQSATAERMRSSLVLFFLLASSAFACSAPEDDPLDTSEHEQRVKPIGTAPGMGTLTVRAPVPLQADNALLTLPRSGSTRLELDRAYPTNEGTASLQIANRWQGRYVHFPVQAGVASTFELGAVALRKAADFTAQAWGVDASTVEVWAPSGAQRTRYEEVLLGISSDGPHGRLRPQNPLGGPVVAFPGTYHLTYGLFDGQDVVVEPGKVADVELGAKSQRRLGVLRAPVRDLPTCRRGSDAPPSSDEALFRGLTATAVKVTASGRERALRKGLPIFLPSAGEVVFGEYVGDPALMVSKTSYAYFLERWFPPIPVAIAAKPGDAPPVTTWARVDVDDVTVTMPDGSTKTVRAEWSLEDAQGSVLVSFGSPSAPQTSCWTGTGIDVPFGRYTLRVRYRREGLTTPTVDRYDLDLRP